MLKMMKVNCFHLQSHTLAVDFIRDPLVGLRYLRADCKVTNCASLYHELIKMCFILSISVNFKN